MTVPSWWSSPFGAIIEIDDPRQTPDPSWTAMTEADYTTAFGAIYSNALAVKAAADTADCNARHDAFDALVAAGIPGTAAHTISGWAGGPC